MLLPEFFFKRRAEDLHLDDDLQINNNEFCGNKKEDIVFGAWFGVG